MTARARCARPPAPSPATLPAPRRGRATATRPPAWLDDLAEVFDRIAFTNDKVWGEELLALLAERKPAAYGAWDTETLTGALKPHGVRSRQVLRRIDGKPTNKQGYDREALAEAVTNSHRFASVD